MKDDFAEEVRKEFLGQPTKQSISPWEMFWKWASNAVFVLGLLFVMLQASRNPDALLSLIGEATPPVLQMYLPPADE